MESQPLYAKCKVAIIDYMVKKDCKAGSLLPSQRAICTMTGHSMITVRRALAELEQEGFVHAVPGKGCFVARDLCDGTVRRGIILLFDVNATFRALNASLRYLQWDLRKRGYELKIITGDAVPSPHFSGEAAKASGVIASGVFSQEWSEFLGSLRCPVVVVGDNNAPIPGTLTLANDLSQDIRLAVDYFQERGLTRFAFFNGPATYMPGNGLAAEFEASLRRNQLPFSKDLLVPIDDDNRSAIVRETLAQLNGRFDCLLVEYGVFTDVVSAYFEHDEWEKPMIGVVGNLWHTIHAENRRIVRFGRRENIFQVAVGILFDAMLNPDGKAQKHQKIILA